MIICKYNKKMSKDNGPFLLAGQGEFSTVNEDEAKKIVKKWNRLGLIKNKVIKLDWNYTIEFFRKETLADQDNINIRYLTIGNS